MKKFKAILLDLDGTLAHTAPGIYHCYEYALTKLAIQEYNPKLLEGVIGSKPIDVFVERFQLDRKTAEKALDIYKKRYNDFGILRAELYGGVADLLLKLKEKGYLIGVATLKSDYFARKMLENLRISQYFDIICGMDDENKKSKSQIILQCLKFLKISPAEAIMIGDSPVDAVGAKESGVEFAAVLYGYGYTMRDQIKAEFVAQHVHDIIKYL